MSLLGKYGSQADRARVSAHWVRLLGAFDTYLLGYADRELVVPAKYTKRVNAGGGIVRPTLLIDGRVGGTWKSLRQRSQLEIVVDPFEPLDREARAGIESEAADIERFLGLKATVNIGSS